MHILTQKFILILLALGQKKMGLKNDQLELGGGSVYWITVGLDERFHCSVVWIIFTEVGDCVPLKRFAACFRNID